MRQKHAEKPLECISPISDYRSVVLCDPSQVLPQRSSHDGPTELLERFSKVWIALGSHRTLLHDIHHSLESGGPVRDPLRSPCLADVSLLRCARTRVRSGERPHFAAVQPLWVFWELWA